MSKDKNLQYPHMRTEMLGYLRELSDVEFQRKNWLPKNSPNGIPKSQFDYAVHFLFDDTTLSTNPERCVGWFIRDEQELDLIKDVVSSIETLFSIYETNLTDEQYMEKPEWANVVSTSQYALSKISEN